MSSWKSPFKKLLKILNGGFAFERQETTVARDPSRLLNIREL
jgi:hypothetical protein